MCTCDSRFYTTGVGRVGCIGKSHHKSIASHKFLHRELGRGVATEFADASGFIRACSGGLDALENPKPSYF